MDSGAPHAAHIHAFVPLQTRCDLSTRLASTLEEKEGFYRYDRLIALFSPAQGIASEIGISGMAKEESEPPNASFTVRGMKD